MYRLTVLFGLAFIACQAADVDLHKCMMLFHPKAAVCCKKNSNALKNMDENIKDCINVPRPEHGGPPMCERDLCIAEKKGFLASDGTINKDALKSLVEKDFADSPALGPIMEKCINGDTSKFAPPEFCEVTKLRHCILYQSYVACPEWEDIEQCTKVKELSEQCKF